MNAKTKLKLTDTLQDMVITLSEGNPGAATVLMKLMKSSPIADPDCAFGPIGPLLSLDSFGIYGSKIWMLYKDICGLSELKMLAVLRAIQLGHITDKHVKDCIDKGLKLDLDEILKWVQKELPAFGKEYDGR